MNFKLTNIILVNVALAFGSSSLLDGVNGALQPQQQQLRGRNLDAPKFCPEKAPANGSSCLDVLPRGWNFGDCNWGKSTLNPDGSTTSEKNECTCTRQAGTWSCTDDFGVSITSPPTATSIPPVTASDNTRRKLDVSVFKCPEKAPADGSSCANILPNRNSGGHCGWQQDSDDGVGTTTTEKDTCACTEQGGNWKCSKESETKTSPPAPSPPPVTSDTNWCPKAIPKTNVDTCKLPTGTINGSCEFNSTTANGITTTIVCGCTADAQPFVCK